MDPVKRVHYFDYQFLRAADFTADQEYHRQMRQLGNRLFQRWGVGEGLGVTRAGPTQVTVAAGVAFDREGRELVLAAPVTLQLGDQPLPDGAPAYVTIAWGQAGTDPSDETGVADHTRWTEVPQLAVLGAQPADPGLTVVLAKLQRTGTEVTGVDTSVRRLIGLPEAQQLREEIATRVDRRSAESMQGPLTVRSSLSVSDRVDAAHGQFSAKLGIGSTQRRSPLSIAGAAPDPPDARFRELMSFEEPAGTIKWHVNLFNGGLNVAESGKADARLYLAPGGNVGIGTAAPTSRLHVDGDLRATELRFGQSVLNADQGGSIELGGTSQVAGVGSPYIDFHFYGLRHDFSARIQNDADRHLTLYANVAITDNLDLHRDLTFRANQILYCAGRLHVNGEERLYVLNKQGVTIGKEWGGNGNLSVQGHTWMTGNLGTTGKDPNVGIPGGWGGGVHTWDVYAEGTIGAGPAGGPVRAWINRDGEMSAAVKRFVIDHPLRPAEESLAHASLEGPELAVYYRGEGRLVDGEAEIRLPPYFEALTRPEGRTVQLTPKDRPVVVAAGDVRDGAFRVAGPGDTAFYWEVKAVRADVAPLRVELSKEETAALTARIDARAA